MALGKKTGGGSRRGIPNRATAEARAAIAAFVDDNAHRLQGWLDVIAEGQRAPDKADGTAGEWLVKPDPERAFALFQSVIEYHVPKLGRQEINGSTESRVIVEFRGFGAPSPTED